MSRAFGNLCWVAVILSGIIYACANRGYPEGGPKDETSPVVLVEVPESFSTHFSGKRIAIYFNEYVQLKDVNNEFIMSPPMKKSAKVNLRGKYILVEIQDTLKPETT
jgi:hypothetical protein